MNKYKEALEDLVTALQNTFWSSWQSTASFQKELDQAEELLNKGYNDED